MNKAGQILLALGALVLALLIGVLIGRGQRVEPTSEGNAAAVQITTAPPPSAQSASPLPASATPPVAAPPKPPVDLQVQEDAAAVGMTTREPRQGQGQGDSDTPAAPPPKSAAVGSGDSAPQQPPPNG